MVVKLLLALTLSAPDTIALVDFHVLDVAVGRTIEHQTVLVADGLIYSVGPVGGVAVPANAFRIEGLGRTLVPGLVDAHAHVDSADFVLFLANGVTGVRELNGSPQHLEWRDSITAGSVLGPRLLVSSPLLAGAPLRFRHDLITSPSEAVVRVRDLVSEGYDFAKIYDDLSLETYEALTATAQELDLPYVGHLPDAVGLQGALAAKQGLEHAEKIVIELLGHQLTDLTQLKAGADRIAQSGVAVTPTLAVHEVLNGQQDPDFSKRFDAPELIFVDSATMAWWTSLGGGHQPQVIDGELWPHRFLRAQRVLVRELADRGVPLLLGTDTPNPLMVPGFSVHDELAALVGAGLSTLEALQAATLAPGRTLPFTTSVGQIKPGFAADLIVVVGDPLEDLNLLRTPDGVITAGRWLDRTELDILVRRHPTLQSAVR